MVGEEKPKNKRRRLIGIVCSLLSLTILTYIAIMFISGRQSEMFRFFGLFSSHEPVKMADEYHFDVGRNRTFADLDGSLAAAGTLGIQVLDTEGRETLRDSFRMSNPAICAQEGYAIAFDISGTAVRVFSGEEIITSIKADGAIISASINRNGWVSVCTQEGGTSKGVVTVYNAGGAAVYRVNLATGYVLSAVLTPDNKSLAILNLTDDGSRITYYSLNSKDVDRVFDLPDRLIFEICYLPGGDVLAISTDSLLIINKNNEGKELYGFADSRLGGYATGNGFIAIYLLDYGVGHSGRLVTLKEDGNILAEIETDREIVSLSSSDGYLAVLRSDGFALYNTTLDEIPVLLEPAAAAGATKVLALGNGNSLAGSDHSAVVIRIES